MHCIVILTVLRKTIGISNILYYTKLLSELEKYNFPSILGLEY